MKTKTSSLMDSHLVDFSNPNANNIKSNSTTSSQLEISDKVLFEQATVAMEEIYGYGCETEIDAYFRGLKWMQKQFNK